MSAEGFRKRLEHIINSESRENGSNTPDFLLADYLTDCLAVFDKTVTAREKWYGRGPKYPDQPPIDNEHVAQGCEPFNDDTIQRSREGETPS